MPPAAEGIFHRLLRDPLIELAIKVAGLLSIVSISFAICFDLGFLSALQLGIFTFFSLSEHLLFAIEMIPFSFILIMVGLMYVFATSAAINAAEGVKKRETQWLIFLIYSITVFLLIFWIGYKKNFYIGDYLFSAIAPDSYNPKTARVVLRPVLVGDLIATLLVFVTPIIAIIFDNILRFYRFYIFSLAIYVAMLILSYTFGFAYAKTQIIHNSGEKQIIETKNYVKFTARILRAGDKGVLLYDLDRGQLVFMRWENVEEIRGQYKKMAIP
jgi:hypothetical protein